MAHLPTDLRSQLEKVIKAARREAEAGARNALQSLAVDHHEYHSSMSPDERSLRNRLRAHARQLGDLRESRGTQSIARLTHEVAYEHWHRMLFARFLAENNLLVEPDSGVAISMAECEALAREAGEDPRLIAARFAQGSLPQIFRSGDPVLEVTLAPETRQALDKLLDSLPAAVFTADDSLGWTYQYWQTEKKDEVNESGNKIGADELPAVTQLFTEHYMVLFLFHNTIGAWHAGKVLDADPRLAEYAQSEEELRQAVALNSHGGYEFEYLRFVREAKGGDEDDRPTGLWRPAAGSFEGWPTTAKELKVLDPCCGSGHFLTEGLELLVRMRMDEEGLDLEDAIHGVLADNLHGLEIEPRCTQIAAFNLALAAWKLASRPIELPAVHIACSGFAVGSTKAEWTKLAGDNERLRGGMERLYDLFEQAPELGSLVDPKALERDLLAADLTELQPLLDRALAGESHDVEYTERAVAAQGMARATELLLSEYALAITNVPYLGQGQQSDELKVFADEHYKNARYDLATIFVERMLRRTRGDGALAAVSPQTWLFLKRYSKWRDELLKLRTCNLIARLGSGAFEAISGEVVNVALSVITTARPSASTAIAGIDASPASTPAEKATLLRGSPVEGLGLDPAELTVQTFSQADQRKNPDAAITLRPFDNTQLLAEHASALSGVSTGAINQFIREHWEVRAVTDEWEFIQSSIDATKTFGGRSSVILFEEESGDLFHYAQSVKHLNHAAQNWLRGKPNWGRRGVCVNKMGNLRATLYSGDIYDENCNALVPNDESLIPALWCFCSSGEFHERVRELNQSLLVQTKYLIKVPFDLERWQEVAAERYPNGLPEPQSDDPTQWLFHGHPAKAEPARVLQVAVGRLLDHRWPPELAPDMCLADEAREWVSRCGALQGFADEDGIVCLSATRGERSAADRLRELLSAAFGSDWSSAKERELLTVAGAGRRPARDLDVWLRDKFFEEHCKLFKHRPFVWHIWDGNKDGFHCLVNAHRLTGPDGEGRRVLEAITYSYLNDWIGRQKADQRDGKEGADARLAAAQDLQGQLEKILEGEPPYDLFVRWKPLHQQAIGWDPDINDGVRLNVRPFMKAELRKGGKKGAGLLRWKPNIKWGKDRGKEPASLRPKLDYPWFWSCKDQSTDFNGGDEFDGNRWNDVHYTLASKLAAREASASRRLEKGPK